MIGQAASSLHFLIMIIPLLQLLIPVGTTGTYSIPLNDYVLYEGHDFRLQVTPTVSDMYRY